MTMWALILIMKSGAFNDSTAFAISTLQGFKTEKTCLVAAAKIPVQSVCVEVK